MQFFLFFGGCLRSSALSRYLDSQSLTMAASSPLKAATAAAGLRCSPPKPTTVAAGLRCSVLLLLLLLSPAADAFGTQSGTPTPSNTATSSPGSSPTGTPTVTRTFTPTRTGTPSPTATSSALVPGLPVYLVDTRNDNAGSTLGSTLVNSFFPGTSPASIALIVLPHPTLAISLVTASTLLWATSGSGVSMGCELWAASGLLPTVKLAGDGSAVSPALIVDPGNGQPYSGRYTAINASAFVLKAASDATAPAAYALVLYPRNANSGSAPKSRQVSTLPVGNAGFLTFAAVATNISGSWTASGGANGATPGSAYAVPFTLLGIPLASRSPSPTVSATPTPTSTGTASSGTSASATPSPTGTASVSPTISFTPTTSVSPSSTVSLSSSATPTPGLVPGMTTRVFDTTGNTLGAILGTPVGSPLVSGDLNAGTTPGPLLSFSVSAPSVLGFYFLPDAKFDLLLTTLSWGATYTCSSVQGACTTITATYTVDFLLVTSLGSTIITSNNNNNPKPVTFSSTSSPPYTQYATINLVAATSNDFLVRSKGRTQGWVDGSSYYAVILRLTGAPALSCGGGQCNYAGPYMATLARPPNADFGGQTLAQVGTGSGPPFLAANLFTATTTPKLYAKAAAVLTAVVQPLPTPSSTPSPMPSPTPTPPIILCSPGSFNSGGSCTPCPSNTYQPSFGAILCLPCPSAQYSTPASLTCWPPGSYTSPGASTSTQCPVNTYSTDTAATSIDSCLPCDAGSSSSAGSTSCFDSSNGCPGGTYTASFVPLTCPNCAAGSFSAGNASSCTPCPSGLYSPPGTIACALCPQGSFCPGGVETPCPKGWYGLQPLQTDLYQGCAQCPAGTFQPGLRANSLASCSSCAPGSYSPQAGASNCTPCLAGTFNPLLGSISPYACQLCEVGSFSTLPGQSSCASYCPKGTVGTRAGGASASDACSPCPLGTFASSTGSTECSDCPPGSFSDAPTASKCAPCPQGRYANSAAATSFQNCTVCPQGTYGAAAGQTIAGCLPCPPGTASSALGAMRLTQCISCPPGAYSPFAGSSTCVLSPPGSYSGAAATSPTLCPLGKFSSLQGAALASQCSTCPSGKTTTSTGATQDTQCLAIPYTCPSGQQPRAPGATSSTDCIPLACPPPLRPSLFSFNTSDALAVLTSASCLGCPAGSSGALPACSACSGNSFCPGLTSRALLNFSAVSGPFSTTCAPLSTLTGSSHSSSSTPTSISTSTDFFGVPLPTTSSQFLLAWIVIISLLFILAAVVAYSRTSESATGCSALPLRALTAVDLFNMNHMVKDKFSPIKEATPLGGLFTLMGLTTLLTYATYMLAAWLQDNTLVQQSLATMGPSVWVELAGLPWVAPRAASSLGSLALRLTMDGNPGACAAPLSMTTTSLESGAFLLQSTGDCGESGVAQHTLTCPSCRYTSDTSVSLVFDYSCQSMLLEALGARPSYPGPVSLSIISAPTARTAAQRPGALLSSVLWHLTPVLSVLWDNVTAANTNSAMGWYLADSKLTLAPLLTPPALNGSLSIIPTASSVTVTIALSLSSTYSATLLTQRVPITQLLANIVGLSGLLSFFGMSFGWFEAACTRKRGPAPDNGVQAGETAAFSIANPLIHSAPAAADSTQGALGAAGAPSRWIRATDSEGDVWFLSEVDRRPSWALPPGGEVVREEFVAKG